MTTPAHVHTAMTHPPDAPQPPRRTGTAARTAVADNLVPGLLSAALVALMIFAFTLLENRVTAVDNRLNAFADRVDGRFTQIEGRFNAQAAKIDRLDARIDALDAKIDARIDTLDAKIDTRIDTLDAKIDDLALKVTALIAALNKTEEVDAALAGEITTNAPPASDIG